MEKINDIVREMRCGMIPKHRHDRELLLKYADRIEKASKALDADRDNWRRQALDEDARANAATCEKSLQVGNAAKMRAALEELIYGWDIFINGMEEDLDGHYPDHYQARRSDYEKRIHKAKAALAEPLRNCDVGTIEEQRKRFHKEYFSKRSKLKRRWSLAEGALDWAQMPYEEAK